MPPFDLTPREQLEDEVARILGQDDDYYAWTDADLLAVVNRAQARPAPEPAQPPSFAKPKPARPQALPRPARIVWGEPDYFLKDGELWARKQGVDLTGEVREVQYRAPQRVLWQGRTSTNTAVARYLRTGTLEREPGKPYRAVVRDGLKTRHLGYYATREERDAAILTWKLNRPLR